MKATITIDPIISEAFKEHTSGGKIPSIIVANAENNLFTKTRETPSSGQIILSGDGLDGFIQILGDNLKEKSTYMRGLFDRYGIGNTMLYRVLDLIERQKGNDLVIFALNKDGADRCQQVATSLGYQVERVE